MDSKAKILGHSIHPILIVFPLGLLGAAVVFDIVHMIQGTPVFAVVTYWMLAGGLLSGLLAAGFGLIDWIAIPSDTRAKSVGLAHAGANVGAILLFAVSWYLRNDAPNTPGPRRAFSHSLVWHSPWWAAGSAANWSKDWASAYIRARTRMPRVPWQHQKQLFIRTQRRP